MNITNQIIYFKEDSRINFNNKREWNYEFFFEPYSKLVSINNELTSIKDTLNNIPKAHNFSLNKETRFFKSKIKGIENNYKIINEFDLSNSNLNHEFANKSGLNDAFLDISRLPHDSFIIKNNDEEIINDNDLILNTKIKNNKKKQNSKSKLMSKTKLGNNSKSEIYVVHESMTENIARIYGKKMFNGIDLVDRMYNCPEGNIIILSYTESQNLSYLLLGKVIDHLDYVKLEKEIQFQKYEFYKLLNEEKHKFYEEIIKHKSEKEYIIKEYEKSIEGIKEKHKKKTEILNDFLNKMNFRIDISQRYLNENIDNEKEDLKLMEVKVILTQEINKNLSICTKNVEKDEEENKVEKGLKNEEEMNSENMNVYQKKKVINRKASNQSLVDHNNLSNLTN